MTARERFFKKLQQQQNPRRTAALDGSAAADIAVFRQQMAALAQQISQWFDGTGIEVVISTRHLHDLSTLGYSLNSGICRYDIPAIRLQNGERSVNIVPQQLLDGVEKGIVTLSLEAPDGAGSREVFYLSGPGGGLDDPQGAPVPGSAAYAYRRSLFYGGRQRPEDPDRR
ncbi:hypothetical protein KPZU09_18670 [Klebsiella pneumoniae]|uniref:Uncharacterized protein n=1 Tax=Klebsiella pneumoniae TaxID=573 RepID=A0A919HNL6_KLEPN|nr:hypothetical protein KPZU09_18670 [Klebsiella pneumoniae]